MNLSARNIGKKYGTHWVFRNLDVEIKAGSTYALTGKNGVGKSTLLQLLSGFLTPSEGTVQYDGNALNIEKLDAVFIGPYTEIIEEFTLREFLHFHAHFKKANISFEEMAAKASLPTDKSIADFSTGMKQRVKLITAFYFANSMIFMDEPTANLDQEGFRWWQAEIETLEKTVLIASNDTNEIAICPEKINL